MTSVITYNIIIIYLQSHHLWLVWLMLSANRPSKMTKTNAHKKQISIKSTKLV